MKGFLSTKLAISGLSTVLVSAFGAVAVFSFAASGQAPLFKDNVIVTSNDLDYDYTGQDIQINGENAEIELESGQLAPGDYLAVEPIEETYFRAGTYKNRAKYKILDFNGQDVTKQYNTSNNWGNINIKPRTIDLSVNTDVVNVEDIKNGQALNQDQLIIGEDGIAPTDTLTAKVTKKEVGDVYTFNYSFSVYNNIKKVDVTDCYTMKTEINFSNRPDLDVPPLDEWPDFGDLPPVDINVDDSMKDFLEDLMKDFPSGEDINSPLFAFNADKEGEYYFRGTSLGDYYQNSFSEATPYTAGNYSPLEFATYNIKDESSKAVVSFMTAEGFNTNDFDFVPNYTESRNKSADDVSYRVDKEDGNKYHTTCYLVDTPNLDNIQNNYISDSDLRREERNYQSWVHDNYTYVRSTMSNSLNDFYYNYIDDGMGNMSLQTFVDNVKNVFLRDFKYDLSTMIDNYSDNILTFLNETKRGYFFHYATAGSLLLRNFGYPSRVVAGFKKNYQNANEPDAVTLKNVYAWTEVYIDNYGWVALDFCPATAYEPGLDEEDHQQYVDDDPNSSNTSSGVSSDFDRLPPSQDALFQVQVSEPGDYYLRKEHYGDFAGANFGPADIYQVNDNPNPNYFLGMQLKESGKSTRQVTIKYNENETRDKDLVSSYYYGEGDPTSNNDVYFVPQVNDGVIETTSTMTDIDYDFTDDYESIDKLSFGSNYTYIEAEALYYHTAYTKFTNIPNEITKGLDAIADKYFPIMFTEPKIIVRLIVQYLQQVDIKYNPLVEYDTTYNPGDTIEDILARNPSECDSSMIAAAATILLRYFKIPARLVNGYLYRATDTNVGSVSNVNRYYWNEIYIKGHGWVKVDFTKAGGILDNSGSYYEKKTKIKIKTESHTKEYDGVAYEYVPTYEIIEGELKPGHYIYVDEGDDLDLVNVGERELTAYYYIYDESGEDVSYQYAIETEYGILTITQKEITVYTKSVEEAYEKGKVLESEIYDVEGIDLNKYEIKYTSETSLDSVGSCPAEINVYGIYDKATGENVIDNFYINYVNGELRMY